MPLSISLGKRKAKLVTHFQGENARALNTAPYNPNRYLRSLHLHFGAKNDSLVLLGSSYASIELYEKMLASGE
jgi:hypothetical protein